LGHICHTKHHHTTDRNCHVFDHSNSFAAIGSLDRYYSDGRFQSLFDVYFVVRIGSGYLFVASHSCQQFYHRNNHPLR
jgi:hypothetical protein